MTDQLRIMLIFSLHAIAQGSLFSRIPEIQRDLALDRDSFGLVLTGIPVGVLVGSLLISQLIERIGTRKTTMWFMAAFALAPLFAALVTNGVQLFFVLVVFGLTLSCTNVAMNVEADRVEAISSYRIFNRCHGVWGVGFLLSSLTGALLIWAGISPLVHFMMLITGIAVAVVVLIGNMVEAPPREISGAPPKRFAIPNRSTFLIVGFALAGIWFEGSVRNWGVIYLRDGFHVTDWYAALALPAMMLMQTSGRFMADGWITRFGDVKMARALTCVSFAGLLTIVTTGNSAVALFGFAMIGLGISTVFPQSFSAAARWGGRPASENVAAFSSLQTVISFTAPAIIGFLAAWLGLRLALTIFLPLPLLALYFARYLAPRPE